MADTFKVGDIVTLKSGGPDMTVLSVFTHAGKEMAKCAWFEGTDQHEAGFPVDVLRVPEPPSFSGPPVGSR